MYHRRTIQIPKEVVLNFPPEILLRYRRYMALFPQVYRNHAVTDNNVTDNDVMMFLTHQQHKILPIVYGWFQNHIYSVVPAESCLVTVVSYYF